MKLECPMRTLYYQNYGDILRSKHNLESALAGNLF